jgi:hypothetical protein
MTASVLMNVAIPGGGFVWYDVAPRAGFSLPGYTNIDLRITKQFRITERFNFELRGELFNLFNSTLILGVDTNAYTYALPSGSTSASNLCKNRTADPVAGHTNTCMVPTADFGNPDTTTGALAGPRQVQFGAKLTF